MTLSKSYNDTTTRYAFAIAFVCAILFVLSDRASAGHPKIDLKNGWKPLFNGKDLSDWACPEGSWAAENGVITRRGGGFLTSVDQYDNFILDLEFKLAPKANSGVIFRHIPQPGSRNAYWWDGLLEMQVADSHAKAVPNKYHKAMKDMPRKGFLFLQDHGDPVWYRNIFIKPLEKK